MLPSLNCIIQSSSRYFWLASICYGSEQLLTFVEVNREVKQTKVWVKDRFGKNTNEFYFVEVSNHSFKGYENGIYVVAYPRSVLEARINENKVKVLDISIKINVSEKENILILEKEINQALQIKIKEVNYG